MFYGHRGRESGIRKESQRSWRRVQGQRQSWKQNVEKNANFVLSSRRARVISDNSECL